MGEGDGDLEGAPALSSVVRRDSRRRFQRAFVDSGVIGIIGTACRLRRRALVAWILAFCVSVAASGLRAQEATAGSFRFVDVAAEAGLARFVSWAGRKDKDHLLDSAGTGAAFLDYDRDGRLDVFLLSGWRLEGSKIVERGRNALFRGRPEGRFEDVTLAAGVAGTGEWSCGAFAADYDADGWTDVLVTQFGRNLLYRNRGDGSFEELAERLGIAAPGWNTGAAFFDAEGDGDLDLYLAGYIDCTVDEVLQARRTLDWKGREKVAAGPFGLKGAPDRFFRFAGGRYVEATKEAGFEDKALAFGFGVRAADYDRDGDVDVFVANDSDANYFYRNEGRGVFREIGLLAGCALSRDGNAQASMGVAVGDPSGDGLLDLLVSTFADDTSTLFVATTEGLYNDVSAAWGLVGPTYAPLSWGVAFADLDRDGDQDLVALNGHIYPQVDRHPDLKQSFAQSRQLLENRGRGFVDVSAAAGPGFAALASGRGLAVGDYDNDGDLDLLCTQLDGPPALLRNDSRGGSWLTIVPEDARGPIVAIGARATVRAGGRVQVRDVAVGESFLSTHDPRLHFGLGQAERVERVELRWPDGSISVREELPARQFLRIRPGT